MTAPPRRAGTPPHAVHRIVLAFPIAAFTGAVATDITYLNSAEMQWSNFSAWLVTTGLVFGAMVVLWALIDWLRHRRGARTGLPYLLILAAMWIVGLVNAFQHSRDGWSSVGTLGLTLSIASALLALVAGAIAYRREIVR